jgi:hypothetical protein
MSDLGIGQVIGKLAGKIMNAANGDRKLKCYDCKKITPHIAISYADFIRAGGKDNWEADIEGVVLDLVPFSGPLLSIGNPYACTCCQRIKVEGGIGSNKCNNGYPRYLK